MRVNYREISIPPDSTFVPYLKRVECQFLNSLVIIYEMKNMILLPDNFCVSDECNNLVSAQVFDLYESVQICRIFSAGFCKDRCTES